MKIEKYKRKIKILQQKERRNKEKIINELLKSLKKKCYLQENELNIIGNISKCNKGDLFKRLLKKSSNKSIPKTYTPELRSFALTLNYYSPKAYTYVRNKLHLVSCFSKEALNCIKEKVIQSNYPLLGALIIIDEMSIRQHLEYDGKKCSGYIDMGTFNEMDKDDDSLPVAKDALVFSINCVNGAWKIPVAYFLINGITSDKKVNLIKNCHSFLHDTGMQIISLTFDGTSSNIKMAKELDCDFNNLNTLQLWFRDPQTNNKIYIYLDPCHMIKLVRNPFGALKWLMNESGGSISWKFMEKLREIQEKEGLHLANKLRTAHINYVK
ncbi:THAP domain-containing protein 9 [Cyphomyrmex costatus]|uniref:THAP domain-containing protein 9 n=1 Tax=Cyphomyrmex costatus TaxID=456900 RepID=A0A151K3D0_9HYME|nr:THAP domain-containing protein 9 [Cyphomyrmex costatus]